jgi:hypothetical protein
MGFLDKIKQVFSSPPPGPAEPPAAPAPTGRDAGKGTFMHDGDVYPMPPGWDGLSIDAWFDRFEAVRDRMMNFDPATVPAMKNEDGDPMDPEEVILVKEFGFKNGGHWENFRNWGVAQWAKQTGESSTDVEFRMSGMARERLIAKKAGALRSSQGGSGQLDPVEGVSIEQWAKLNAQGASGGDVLALAAQAGIDQGKWARVNAEWLARMQRDTSGAITTVYAAAFAGAGQGQFSGQAAHASTVGVGGDLSNEPVSYERFVEITVSQDAAHRRGQDPIAALKSLGLTPVDWSNIGAFWSKKFQQEATKYHRLHLEFTAKYEKKYGIGDGLTQDQREEKVLGELLQMCRAGRSAQVVAHIKQNVPGEQDNSAIDWWLDKTCDALAQVGDQKAARQLLAVRYPLQDGEDDPMGEWIESQMNSLF